VSNERRKRRAKPPGSAGAPGKPAEARREAARKLVERALGSEDLEKRASLARKALKIDDSASEAWGILAELQEDDTQAARLFGEALSRAEGALGEEANKAIRNEQKGDPAMPVWEDAEGLTYLRARAGLGLRLANLEESGKGPAEAGSAMEHLLGVLRLDPDDEIGVSHATLAYLLGRGDEEGDEAARHSMGTHPCDCVHHCFSGTLLSYREHGGEDQRTKRSLIEAIGSGPVVAPFLFEEMQLPTNVPPVEVVEQERGMSEKQQALLLSASVASDLLPAWRKTPGAQNWLAGVYDTLISHFNSIGDDPYALLSFAGTRDEGLARVLGVALSWSEADAALLFWREREDEDVALSKFKDALETLIEDRASGAGLTVERGTAPYPTGQSPFAALLGEPEGVSPLSYLHATGPAGKVAALADDLLDLGFADFTLASEHPEALEELYAITSRRPAGVMVFEGPVGSPG